MYFFIKSLKKYGKSYKNVFILLCLTLIIQSLSGCGSNLSEPVTVNGYKLNTYVSIAAYTTGGSSTAKLNDILNEALSLCDTYEKLFSRTLPESALYKLNNHQCSTIPDELARLILLGIKYGELSGGVFDITIGSVSSLWDFTADNPHVPDDKSIKEALKYVNYKNIKLIDNNDGTWTADVPDGTIIDLGAVAKGYIADRIKDFLLENNINRAVINLGGNILCVGSKNDNAGFNIGLKNPFSEEGTPLVTLSLNDKSVVSSGTYERFFYENDVFYHHILDPETGYPCENELTGVTILSPLSADGDCLSTVCFTLGVTRGLELIENTSDVEALFLTSDGNIIYSSGFEAYLR